jgi:adenylate kinase
LDGFPRNEAQAAALESAIARTGHKIGAALYLRVSADEATRRLAGRRTCRSCNAGYHLEFMPPAKPGVCDRCGGELYQRDDDRPETVRQRLQVFEKSTAGLVAHYRAQGLLREIDASGSPEGVGRELLAAVPAIREGP